MREFYVNTQAQSNGDHEVHTASCSYLPSALNRKYLGQFYSCHGAVAEAKKIYATPDGCEKCSNDCHKS